MPLVESAPPAQLLVAIAIAIARRRRRNISRRCLANDLRGTPAGAELHAALDDLFEAYNSAGSVTMLMKTIVTVGFPL